MGIYLEMCTKHYFLVHFSDEIISHLFTLLAA